MNKESLSETEKQKVAEWGLELLCMEVQGNNAANSERCLDRALKYYQLAKEKLDWDGYKEE